MLTHFKSTLTVLASLVITPVYAEILSVNSLDQVNAKFEQTLKTTESKDILGLIAIDQVILQPSIPAMQIPNQHKYQDILHNMLVRFTDKEKDILQNLLASDTLAVLVEPTKKSIITKIISKVKIIGFTSLLTGALDDIPNYEMWRYESLKDLGIDFSKSFVRQEISLANIPAYMYKTPKFYKGILNTNGSTEQADYKAKVVVEFLKQVQFHPEAIIFVSADKDEINQLQTVMKNFDAKIQFCGLHYTGAANYPSKIVEQSDFVKIWERLIEKTKNISENLK